MNPIAGKRLLALAILWAVIAASPALAVEPPTWEEIVQHYTYNPEMPLEHVAADPVDRGTYTLQDVQFKSVNDQTVPGTLCKPKGVEKPPVILVLHGLGGCREDIVKLFVPFISGLGIATFAIDAPLHGERSVEGVELIGSAGVGPLSSGFGQAIFDNRRALDYLETRDDLDTERMSLVGVSMGSIMGSMVTSLDERLDAAYLIVGGGDLAYLFANSTNKEAVALRGKGITRELLQMALRFIEPTYFVGHIAPRPVFMVNGRDDQIILPHCAEALYNALKEPKDIVWYEGGLHGGHVPPIDVLAKQLRAFLDAQGLVKEQAGEETNAQEG